MYEEIEYYINQLNQLGANYDRYVPINVVKMKLAFCLEYP